MDENPVNVLRQALDKVYNTKWQKSSPGSILRQNFVEKWGFPKHFKNWQKHLKQNQNTNLNLKTKILPNLKNKNILLKFSESCQSNPMFFPSPDSKIISNFRYLHIVAHPTDWLRLIHFRCCCCCCAWFRHGVSSSGVWSIDHLKQRTCGLARGVINIMEVSLS